MKPAISPRMTQLKTPMLKTPYLSPVPPTRLNTPQSA